MSQKKLSYSSSGVNYELLDKLKRMAQIAGAELTLAEHTEVEAGSRGESAAVIRINEDFFITFAQEGLGTKNLVADAMLSSISKKTYYDQIGYDTVATIINDLITVGTQPLSVAAYWAIGNEKWLENDRRMVDLITGWKNACEDSGAGWIGGETPILSGIVIPNTIDLAGSAIGIITSRERLTLGQNLTKGDVIILFESSGIHANGLSLARSLANELPQGYQTLLSNGQNYGEALLTPSFIYAKVIQAIFEAGVDIHYMVHITGHGWRKLMRHNKSLTYRIKELPPVPEVLRFIQESAEMSDEEAYATFNMGAGYAIFVPATDVEKILQISQGQGVKAYNAGVVEEGEKQVIIEPLNITYKKEDLAVRA